MRKCVDKQLNICYNHSVDIIRRNALIYHYGDIAEEVPPVLIPNTEVKLLRADGTGRVTGWKSRTLPYSIKRGSPLFFV